MSRTRQLTAGASGMAPRPGKGCLRAHRVPLRTYRSRAADTEIGRMPVDSTYNPVLKVTYKAEATRVEQRTDFDSLVIDVETKPSILRRDATRSRRPARPWSSWCGPAEGERAEREGAGEQRPAVGRRRRGWDLDPRGGHGVEGGRGRRPIARS